MIGKKPAPTGAPEWVLTYGDMMSLLLCFFILLAAFADFDAGGNGTVEMSAAIESIREALGIRSPARNSNDKAIEFNSLADSLKRALRELEQKTRSNTVEEGLQGRNFRVRRIRDGMEITLGGPLLFEPFSTKMTEDGTLALGNIAEVVKGHRNKLEIRGHASEEPKPADWTYDDAMTLSYQRARVVAGELIQRGADPRTIRIVAVGDNEPLPPDRAATRQNESRRVEIIVRESLIDDYSSQPPSPQSAPSATTSPSAE